MTEVILFNSPACKESYFGPNKLLGLVRRLSLKRMACGIRRGVD